MPAALPLLDMGHAAYHQASLARGISRFDPLPPDDDPTRGKIRSGDALHQLRERDLIHRLVIVDQVNDRVGQLTQVVGRDVGCHAHRDAGCPVQEHIRDAGGQDERLFERFIEVGTEVDRVLVDIGQKLLGKLVQTGLGVTHRGRGVAVHRAEVALSVDEHVAHREILGHARHGLIDGRVTVRVEFTQHLTHDTGGFLVGCVGTQSQLLHGIQYAAVDRLQAIACVGKGAGDDHAHRIIQIRITHLGIDINLLDISVLAVRGNLGGFVCHLFLFDKGSRHKKDTKARFCDSAS